MKKDFTQPFKNADSIRYYLLVQDSLTRKFLLFQSVKEVEDDWHRTLSCEIKRNETLNPSLAKFLYSEKLVLNGYRELARQTDVAFSFLDGTPGAESTEVCLLVTVDLIAGAQLDRENEKAVFVSLNGLLPAFSAGPYISHTVALGIGKLHGEVSELGSFHPGIF